MKIEKFKETLVAFDLNKGMVNATDMIKNYPSKKMNNFLRKDSTKKYIEHLESKTQNSVLVVNHGGSGHGTWMCEKLALEFASWLDFEIKDFIYDTFLNEIKSKLKEQQRQLDYFWDREDRKDLY